MKFQLNKYEVLVLKWYIFLKKPIKDMQELINRFKAERQQEKIAQR